MSNIERRECPEHGASTLVGKRCYAQVSPYVSCDRETVIVEYVPADALRGAVEDFKRVGKLAAWLIRDRREFDKVTAYAGELEALARRHGGSS